jgi:putative membrane protein
MKRSLAILVLSTVFLSTAAFAQSAAEKTGINSTLGIAPKTADFVKEAAMSDMLEIEAAKIAQQKGDADERPSPRR